MSEDGFLRRWSERKRAEQAAVERVPPEPEPPEAAPAEAPTQPLSADELAQLTPLEAMTVDTDLGQYLRKGVPAALQRAALRRMWVLNPRIRDYLDDARDYAWDWNAPGKLRGSGSVELARAADAAARILQGRPRPAPPPPPQDEAAPPLAEPVPSPAAPLSLPEAAEPRPRGRGHGSATPSVSKDGDPDVSV